MLETRITAMDLLGVEPREVVRELLQRAKLDVLFEAQQIGRREPSGATAGTLLYAAGTLGVPDDELRPYFAEMASMIDSNGSLEIPPEYRITIETNWTDARCLSAMQQRPHLTSPDTIDRLATSFIQRQEASGGWGLRPDCPGQPHPLFSLPATLVLRRLKHSAFRASRFSSASIANLISYLRQSPRESVLVQVLRATQLQLLDSPYRSASIEDLHDALWQGGELHMDSFVLVREDQPLWYSTIDKSLMVLATRHLWPPLDPVNVRLGSEVIDSYDASRGGWRNHDTDAAICTWRTAESLLAVELLARDLASLGLTLESWNLRRKTSDALRATDGFDVGICFSSKQRDVAAKIRKRLRDGGLTVFYDEDYQHELLGADLNVYLHDIYFRRCRYAIAILSEDFIRSKWSGSLEWRAILTRFQEARSNFLLPYYMDDVEVPGLSSSIGYLRSRTHTPEQFADVVLRKILSQKPRKRD
ncbi:MAG: TIR domain-containing protein [Gammaproteobacteria bacterium]